MKLVSAAALVVTLAACGPGQPVASGCCTYPPSAPPGGISRAESIETVLTAAGSTHGLPQVVWAVAGTNPFMLRGSVDPGWVWLVRLQGGFAAPCASGFLEAPPRAGAPACLDGEGGAIAVVDFYDGHVLGWTH